MKLLSCSITPTIYFKLSYGLKKETLKALSIKSKKLVDSSRGVIISEFGNKNYLKSKDDVNIFQKIKLYLQSPVIDLINPKKTIYDQTDYLLVPENYEHNGFIIDFKPYLEHEDSILIQLESLHDSTTITRQFDYKIKYSNFHSYEGALIIVHCDEDKEQKFYAYIAMNSENSFYSLRKIKINISPVEDYRSSITNYSLIKIEDDCMSYNVNKSLMHYLYHKCCNKHLKNVYEIIENSDLYDEYKELYRSNNRSSTYNRKLKYSSKDVL
jgi:hypothetical protein